MKGILLVALSVLYGCEIQPQKNRYTLGNIGKESRTVAAPVVWPVCSADEQCAAMWDAAQLWVVQNAGMKIQIATNVVIQTFNSRGQRIAVSVTKQRGSNGTKIVASMSCANIFGCRPTVGSAVRSFNRAVKAAGREFET